jgi:hypothetical protein
MSPDPRIKRGWNGVLQAIIAIVRTIKARVNLLVVFIFLSVSITYSQLICGNPILDDFLSILYVVFKKSSQNEFREGR